MNQGENAGQLDFKQQVDEACSAMVQKWATLSQWSSTGNAGFGVLRPVLLALVLVGGLAASILVSTAFIVPAVFMVVAVVGSLLFGPRGTDTYLGNVDRWREGVQRFQTRLPELEPVPCRYEIRSPHRIISASRENRRFHLRVVMVQVGDSEPVLRRLISLYSSEWRRTYRKSVTFFTPENWQGLGLHLGATPSEVNVIRLNDGLLAFLEPPLPGEDLNDVWRRSDTGRPPV